MFYVCVLRLKNMGLFTVFLNYLISHFGASGWKIEAPQTTSLAPRASIGENTVYVCMIISLIQMLTLNDTQCLLFHLLFRTILNFSEMLYKNRINNKQISWRLPVSKLFHLFYFLNQTITIRKFTLDLLFNFVRHGLVNNLISKFKPCMDYGKHGIY